MKFLPLILLFSCIGCSSNKKISSGEREKIIIELDYIGEIDQRFAGIPSQELIARVGGEKAWELFLLQRDSVQNDNQNRIVKLFSKYGYLGFKEVGEKNSTKFWLPIQHADNNVKFQQKMLIALKKQIEISNANKSEYAMLEDRIAINNNEKQRFGSQVAYRDNGQAVPKNGLTDSLKVDKLRKEYNLPSFKEYYNIMTLQHFEMNKENFLKNGITEPTLYK